MRAIFAGILGAALVIPAFGAMRVDGVPVRGRVNAVSITDIREALATEPLVKASQVEVISSNEMRVYFGTHDQGWSPIRRQAVIHPDGKKRMEWHLGGEALVFWAVPAALQVIRSASEVYVFPVLTPLKPRRDTEHMRVLDADARRSLARVLGNEINWFHGNDDSLLLGGVPKNVGFVFRNGKDELTLFCVYPGRVFANFNGVSTDGTLVERPSKRFEEWKKHYARPELALK
jgi:hypothetical protein